jgi:hypothetical protein
MEQTRLQTYIALAKEGTKQSVGALMQRLNRKMTIAESKELDFALGHVETEEGVKIMEHYLFHGTQIHHHPGRL